VSRARFNAPWLKRVAAVVVIWAAVVAVGVLFQMSPRPLLLAAAVLAGGSLLWLVTDIGTATQTSRWQIAATVSQVTRGSDPRVGILHRSLSDPDDRRGYSRNVHPTLVSVVDERLRTRHGIDRAAEPARAREVLGDDLADFLRQPCPGPAGREPRHLADLLTRIESL